MLWENVLKHSWLLQSSHFHCTVIKDKRECLEQRLCNWEKKLKALINKDLGINQIPFGMPSCLCSRCHHIHTYKPTIHCCNILLNCQMHSNAFFFYLASSLLLIPGNSKLKYIWVIFRGTKQEQDPFLSKAFDLSHFVAEIHHLLTNRSKF